ncbi:hypothetical protein COW36_01170 [bacterium (Candidatus Blackallbacteria) CG17_big_fil_post_rev_8_21_14_2_50_48_46]|uniref:Uncharacterized protein n=1 Tax=bacterium (Candidatus Blackallbacteria) CG17_big_fil_post_rev_8_21_14_2_50_48_46 TaxID=2014261 RepID=A0A2M7GBB0_9BACT|nr:MAG: hypothetical protein COW64_10005 [bacterium (Candidatus Blackallbacteria) CG18_big_fil_WC_8_21_14_2_50_49_26]PIW19479.1 MAG: hypothetical protein COW36_01170 [bacterium (Candidatus Blackallbacteria) CG17_big_fil_post_rev_8_21_14_2_50_48_46]PIW48917.1 MAG: hypothetical protein COW20_07285 [bacterium (Candidatus Blackallbacteria) CG13_big_fil_rev_8_21_14_2_50_49_14]
MRKNSRHVLLILTLLVCSGLLPFYLHLSQVFPFDYYWDMDASTAQDTLLLNSHKTPAHLDHPKFAMVAILASATRMARAHQLISVASLEDLKNAADPALGLAELTLFLRKIQAVLVWLFVLTAVVLLVVLFPHMPWLWLSASLALGLEGGVLHMAMTLRSEIFSLFLLALALLSALMIRQAPRFRLSALLLCGVFSSLAVMTKVQAIIAMPVVLAFQIWQMLEVETPEKSPKPQTIGLQLLPGLLLFFILAWPAWFSTALPGRTMPVANFSQPGSLKLPVIWLGLVFLPLPFLFLFQRLSHRWQNIVAAYPGFLLGLSLAFVFPLFCFFPDFNLGWHYLQGLLRASIWMDISSAGTGSIVDTLRFIFSTRADYLVICGVGFAFLGWELWSKQREQMDYFPLAMMGVSLFCLFPLLLFGNRALLRDTVWYEFWGIWVAMACLGYVFSALEKFEFAKFRVLGYVFAFILAWNSISQQGRALDASYLNNSAYGFDGAPYDYFWYHTVYLHQASDNPYREIMQGAYPAGKEQFRQVLSQAREITNLKTKADLSLLNQNLSVLSLGVLVPGLRVSQNKQGWWRVLSPVHPVLEKALSFDLARQTPAVQGQQITANSMPQNPYFADIFAPGGAYTLLPAFHQPTALILCKPDLLKLGADPGSRPADLTLSQGQAKVDCYGFILDEPVVFYPSQLQKLRVPLLVTWTSKGLDQKSFPLWSQLKPAFETVFQVPR